MTHSYVKRNVGENRRGNEEWKIQRHCQHWVHRTQAKSNKTNNTTQKRKMMRNTDTTKYRGLTQVLMKGKQFMPRLRRPACYSYSSDIFDTTMLKQTKTKHK